MSVKDHIFPLLSVPSGLLPATWLYKPVGNTYFLPFYHLISDDPPSHIKHLYRVINFKTFQKHLDHILKFFEPVSIEMLLKDIREGNSSSRPVMHLSFDDGLKECMPVSEILEKKGVPATFFVNSSFIRSEDCMYRYKVSLIIEKIENLLSSGATTVLDQPVFQDIGKERLLNLGYHDSAMLDEMIQKLEIEIDNSSIYMNESDIKGLIDKGFDVGGHSMDHPFFKDITLEEQKRQVLDNMKDLDYRFNLKHKTFAFPFSDQGVSNGLVDWMKNELKLDLIFGTSGLKTARDPFHLQRVPMEEIGPHNVNTEFLYFKLKSLLGKNYHNLIQ